MFRLVHPPEAPCGCGSGKAFGTCCLKDGEIRLHPKGIEPPAPKTSTRQRKCILEWTGDCCGKISGDHIVSAAVLRVLNEKEIQLSTRNFTRHHAINSNALKVNRLCRRHNSALSPIDSEAARFFSTFVQIDGHLHTSTDGQRLHFFHGLDIERWLLKTLMMVYHAKLSNVAPPFFQLPSHASLGFRLEFGHPLGLYIPAKRTDSKVEFFRTERAASVSLLTNENLVCGVNVTLGGLPLTLMIDGSTSDIERLAETHVYRPKHLLFFKGESVYCMGLAFRDGSQRDIWFSHGDPNAPIPTNEGGGSVVL